MHAAAFREVLRPLLDPIPAGASVRLPGGATLAAVLAPILGQGGAPRAVFTRRTDTLRRHAGEISFPGGLVDPGEEPAAAALREVEEELGIRPWEVEVLGALPPVHTHVSGILILPFVGWLETDPRFTPNAAEIAGVLEFRLDDLIAQASEREIEHDGRRFTTHVFDMNGDVIWGATGRILRSLLDMVQSVPSLEEA